MRSQLIFDPTRCLASAELVLLRRERDGSFEIYGSDMADVGA